MLLNIGVLIAALCAVAWSQRSSCSRDRMRQCEDALMRAMQQRLSDMTRVDLASKCAGIRDDFNCLLQQTRCLTSESDRNRNGDTLRNALKYIRDGCDTEGASWRDSSCFVGDTMKNCESSYPLGGVQFSSYNPETCRKYNLFQDCVQETVRSRCRPEDERMQGQYMVDSAQDLAWNCGESTSTSDFDRDTNRNRGRYGDRDGERDRERDRDRGYGNDRDRGYGNDRNRDRQSGSDRNGGYSGSSDITCCRTERCDRNRMSQCRDSLSRTIDNRGAGYQDSSKCRRVRDDFNCLLWQTSNCLGRSDRDRDNDLFRRAKDFISSNCDTYGRWTENSCYKTSEVVKCEGFLTNTRGGANFDACRSYLTFRNCIQDNLERRCTREDDLYQGSYLVDKARELSWQCGDERASTGDRYSTFDRRDQYDRTSYDNNRQGQYDSNRQGYDNTPLHLGNEDEDCLTRISPETDRCTERMNDRRKDLYNENDFDARNRISCCSFRNYRTCVQDASRRCQSTRVADSLMAAYRHQLEADNCRRVSDYECSPATRCCASLLAVALACIVAAVGFARRQ